MHNANLRERPPQEINCPVLITPSLVLRSPHIEDISALDALFSEPSQIGQSPETAFPFLRTDAEDFVKRAKHGEIGSYVYAITNADSGKLIGSCGISGYQHEMPFANDSENSIVSNQLESASNAIKRNDVEREKDPTKQVIENKTKAEIFFWLGKAHRDQGYGAEVANALVDTAFRATELKSLHVRVAQDNNAIAHSILSKCGFSLQHPNPANDVEAVNTDHAVYSLTRSNWFDLRAVSS